MPWDKSGWDDSRSAVDMLVANALVVLDSLRLWTSKKRVRANSRRLPLLAPGWSEQAKREELEDRGE